jgi:hypothetical protein
VSSVSRVGRISPIAPITAYSPGEHKPKRDARRQQVFLAPEGLTPLNVTKSLGLQSPTARQVDAPQTAPLPTPIASQKPSNKAHNLPKAGRAGRNARPSKLLLSLVGSAKVNP